MSSVPQPEIVSLKQVADWDLDSPDQKLKVGVPALQRGLVWSPQQVELLWDSILRGFPIGSFVVSSGPVENQRRHGQLDIKHHLLDGQQRSNAIALGFHDPFSEPPTCVRINRSEAILWLDLSPRGTTEYPNSQFPKNSTREFLTRVTTLAHPWGYETE